MAPYSKKRKSRSWSLRPFGKRTRRSKGYRKKRKRAVQRYDQKSNVNVGRSRASARKYHNSQKNKLKRLLANSKKHHDGLFPRLSHILLHGTPDLPAGQLIQWDSSLKIPALSQDDDNTDSVHTDMYRETNKCFVKKIRLRFRLRTLGMTDLPGQTDEEVVQFKTVLLPTQQKCNVVLTIIKDSRPTTLNADGTPDFNPLPSTISMPNPLSNPIQSLYLPNIPATGNGVTQLDTLGAQAALRSYQKNRFTIVATQTYSLSANNPTLQCEYTFNINRMMTWRYAGDAPAGNVVEYPVNCNYLCYLTTNGGQINQMPPTAQGNSRPVSIDLCSCRTYFDDA